MNERLSRRKALITGATSGLGQAMAWALAEAGCVLALHYHRNQDGAEELAARLAQAGHRCQVVQGDLSTWTGPDGVARAAQEAVGSVDILVNNAGGWVEKPLLETADHEWEQLFAVDLRGIYLLCRALAPDMVGRGWGRIINISSIASLNYIPGEGLYGMAKAGVNMLTRTLGVELAAGGVTVNAVAPGWTLPHGQPFPRPQDFPQCEAVPDGRPGHAQEVAALVAFLASDAAAHITGQILPIDGGQSVSLVKGR